jgi:AmmeMemoRadiSam system protein A
MNTEHQKLLMTIAHDAIFKALEAPTANGREPSSLASFAASRWARIKSPPAEGCSRPLQESRDGVGFEIPDTLMEKRATFVTLTIGGRLRGCIGMLEACRPLAEDVAANACAAAFEDPRFPPLTKKEFEKLEIHISVLSPPEELAFSSEADVLNQIRPGIDGLILQEGFRRGTFLPSVWEELPTKELFWAHLKLKAGLPANYWSKTLRVFRYTTEYFHE